MMIQLIDDDGVTIFEAILGEEEGLWNIHCPDEAQQLLAEIQKMV